MKEIGKKTIVIGIIFILMTMSIVTIYASGTTKDQNPHLLARTSNIRQPLSCY
jgi:hypothetical protein